MSQNNNLIIPLNNLELESDELSLPNGKIVRREHLNSKYKKLLKNSEKYIIEISAIENEKPRRTLDRALAIFKLFKDKLVFSQSVYYRDQHDLLPHYVHWIDKDRDKSIYKIEMIEETEFQSFWGKYFELDPTNFAIYRFHLADYRPYLQDRFSDYVESIEYLLVPDSAGGKISYKFRQRGSIIIGRNDNPEDKERIFSNLEEVYNLRSAIVHGDSDRVEKITNKRNKSWEDVTKPVREYCRDMIKYFLRANCLYDNKKRKEYLESETIFKIIRPTVNE